jgi:hypothetical protein
MQGTDLGHAGVAEDAEFASSSVRLTTISNCIASSLLAPGTEHQILLRMGAREVDDES